MVLSSKNRKKKNTTSCSKLVFIQQYPALGSINLLSASIRITKDDMGFVYSNVPCLNPGQRDTWKGLGICNSIYQCKVCKPKTHISGLQFKKDLKCDPKTPFNLCNSTFLDRLSKELIVP